MTSLYVDRRGVSLKADGEALVFYENGERVGTVPLAPLGRIFLRGDVTLSSALLGKLGERGIGVVVLSGRKATPSMLLARPHNDAARRIRQYELSLDKSFCLSFAKNLISNKLRTQMDWLNDVREREMQSRYVLTTAARRIEGALAGLAGTTDLAGVRGIEGAGAAAYFQGFTDMFADSLGFNSRNRRPPKDPVNAVLSLGYTLLHAEAVMALYGTGLDPFVGFYHALDFARESLACDVIEPLRVIVDKHILTVFRKENLRLEDFSFTDDMCLLSKNGRVKFYVEWESIAETLRKQLELAAETVITTIKPSNVAPDIL